MDYCTTDDILRNVGVTETQINPTELAGMLKDAEAEVNRIIKTTCNPKLEFLRTTGNNKRTYVLQKTPLLSIKGIKISGTDISADNYTYDETGFILLSDTAEQFFISATQPNVNIKYYYGWLEEEPDSNKIKTTQSDVTAGSSVEITLDSVDYLTLSDWVKIVGLDGKQEWTQIKSINATNKTITCELIYDHESGSSVFQGIIPPIIKKLTAVIGGIMGAAYMIGSTYDFVTGYTVPDFTVQKGEPYPAYVKIIDDLKRERDFLIGQLPSWPVFA